MKRLFLSALFLVLAISLFAQVKFDLGIKGGVNFSKISMDIEDYSAESVTGSHIGAFGRIGFGRVFIQPELYYSGKGGDITSNVLGTFTSFDYKTMDIPLLLGFRIIKGKPFDLHVVAGPVFSNVTSGELSSNGMLNKSFYENNCFGVQYGLGIDILFLTLDARMESGLGDIYSQPGATSGKSQNFMLSVGFKVF